MDARLENLVWARAGGVCEYCRMPQALDDLTFEIDHIIALKHHGRTVSGNVALACFYCNSYKGPNLSGIDPVTRTVARLFHPRRNKWHRHFRWDGAYLVGRTPIGRATVDVLEINDPERVEVRESLMEEGLLRLS